MIRPEFVRTRDELAVHLRGIRVNQSTLQGDREDERSGLIIGSGLQVDALDAFVRERIIPSGLEERDLRWRLVLFPPRVGSHPYGTESLIVRAMVLTDGKLLVAGPPDLAKKSSGLLALENHDEALDGFLGQRGVFLRVVSTEDGATLAEHELPAPPVFDGMSAAEGRVLIALRDGTVVCWSGK